MVLLVMRIVCHGFCRVVFSSLSVVVTVLLWVEISVGALFGTIVRLLRCLTAMNALMR